MDDNSFDIDKNSRFIVKYLEKKRNHTAKINQFTLTFNGINEPFYQFMSTAIIIKMDSYVELIYASNSSYKLRLTKQGLNIAKYIKSTDSIMANNVIIKSSKFIYLITVEFLKILLQSIPPLRSIKLVNAIVKITILVAAVVGITVGVLQLIEYWNTGHI